MNKYMGNKFYSVSVVISLKSDSRKKEIAVEDVIFLLELKDGEDLEHKIESLYKDAYADDENYRDNYSVNNCSSEYEFHGISKVVELSEKPDDCSEIFSSMLLVKRKNLKRLVQFKNVIIEKI
ncbi:hypothetical protein VQ643_15810 [Pseudomonas sp. F1_0610]|uniref:hypothetical protein n=1 Tax=Pseudomonas sp. F1_0610 TaxID=3114284 RepID=UPI0039C38199